MSVEAVIRPHACVWEFRIADEVRARSIVDPTNRTSRATLRPEGSARSERSGLFWSTRFRVWIDDDLAYCFRRGFWGDFSDPERGVRYSHGSARMNGAQVFEFPRNGQNRFNRTYTVILADESCLPLAVCFFPIALTLLPWNQVTHARADTGARRPERVRILLPFSFPGDRADLLSERPRP